MIQSLTQADIVEIVQAFDGSGFAHLELTDGPVRLVVTRARATEIRSADLLPSIAEVVAPLLGIFQAAPASGAPAYVQPGTKVEPDTTVGILRVMKNEMAVKSGLYGTVVDVLVQDGRLVEYGQTMLRVSAESAELGNDPVEANLADAQ